MKYEDFMKKHNVPSGASDGWYGGAYQKRNLCPAINRKRMDCIGKKNKPDVKMYGGWHFCGKCNAVVSNGEECSVCKLFTMRKFKFKGERA